MDSHQVGPCPLPRVHDHHHCHSVAASNSWPAATPPRNWPAAPTQGCWHPWWSGIPPPRRPHKGSCRHRPPWCCCRPHLHVPTNLGGVTPAHGVITKHHARTMRPLGPTTIARRTTTPLVHNQCPLYGTIADTLAHAPTPSIPRSQPKPRQRGQSPQCRAQLFKCPSSGTSSSTLSWSLHHLQKTPPPRLAKPSSSSSAHTAHPLACTRPLLQTRSMHGAQRRCSQSPSHPAPPPPHTHNHN